MDIDFKDILVSTQAKPLNELASEETAVHKISTDTRTLEKNDLFFALQGDRYDGHCFLEEAVAKGAQGCVVSDPKAVPARFLKTCHFFLVEDTLQAYGDLAKHYRQKFKIPVIAVTGSAGKTTVKEILAQLLSVKFKVLKNRGTENNQVGVPKTIFQLDATHEALVLEIGTSVPGEIERLADIVGPQIGILTQIGHSHLQGLGNLEGVRDEKMRIIAGLERGGKLFLNGEDPMLTNAQSGVHHLIRYGFSKEHAAWTAEQVWCHEKGTSFYANGKDLFETQLIGRHNVLNALAAVAAASLLGLETPIIQKALAAFKPVSGRLNFKELQGIHFIDDSYNANPSSVRAALETLKAFKTRERKGVVIGDMLELGEASENLHRQVGQWIAEGLFDYVVVAGTFCQALADEALKEGYDPSRLSVAKDALEAGVLLKNLAQAGDLVLVKGSRSMRMERIFECFTISSTP